jgi:hypothetical protein
MAPLSNDNCLHYFQADSVAAYEEDIPKCLTNGMKFTDEEEAHLLESERIHMKGMEDCASHPHMARNALVALENLGIITSSVRENLFGNKRRRMD